MTYEWFTGVMSRYLDTLTQNQHRWLQAQEDVCTTWAAALSPAYPLPENELCRRIDGSLLAGASLVQAQADSQRDLLLVTEKLWCELNRKLQAKLAETGNHPSYDVMKQALQVGYVSSSALSKASRQIGHFAATSFSTASLNATREVRRTWRQHQPKGR